MSLLGVLKGKGKSGFGYGSSAADVLEGLDLSAQRILVTGCNSGLGFETMRALAARGATVVGAARSMDKARQACGQVPGAEPVVCELSEPASVHACVAEVKKGKALDAVVCNAGIMALPELKQKHGFELQFFTNHIGHFILVTGLMDHLESEGRAVIVSSSAHQQAPPGGIEFDNLSGERGYSSWTAYGQSKLANILFAKELSQRLEGARSANALHPGVIQTNLGRHLPGVANVVFGLAGPLVLKSIPEGAATQCYVAAHPNVAAVTGEYFADCNVARPSRCARDEGLAARLWERSEAIVAQVS